MLPDTYNICAYNFVKEANFHRFLYSALGIKEEDALFLLQSSSLEENREESRWALDIARLTNCNAVVGEDGAVIAVPVRIINRDYPTLKS